MKLKQLSLRLVAAGLAVATLVTPTGSAAAADTWKVDPVHSTIGFTIKHFVSKVHGRFDTYTATIALDGRDYATAVVAAEIDAGSINTENDDRDKHLKNPDFFDVEKFPRITFRSTAVKPKTADSGLLLGELTLHGVTKPVELQYSVSGFLTDPWGNDRAGFEATGKINRKDFGVSWNKALDAGGFVLGDEVTLNISIEAVKEKPAAPPAR